MEQSQHQPLYAAKDRVPFNLTLVLALGIAMWGLAGLVGILPPPGNPEMIIALGLAVTAYTWLFTPREYMVYNDAVCVVYGRPRVKTIHFSNIAVVEMGSPVSIDQLRIRPIRGRRQSIRVRDPEAFYDELESALNAYRAAHPEESGPVEFTGRRPPDVIEGGPVVMEDAEAGAASETMTATEPVDEALPSAVEEEQPTAEDQPVNELAESPEVAETVEDAGEADGEDEEKPQQPENRSFY